MAEVVYLAPNEKVPEPGAGQRWLLVEASPDGRFFGTGSSWRMDGQWVGYCSLPEDDASLETALAAAQAWAEKFSVPAIWVQLTP